jgi:formylglycine-generating enzyme required for sulfatase activity
MTRWPVLVGLVCVMAFGSAAIAEGGKPGSAGSPASQPARPTMSLDVARNVPMRFVLVPAGKLTVAGSSGRGGKAPTSQRDVIFARPFYIGVTEVTQEQWKAVMATEPWAGKDLAPPSASQPASCIGYDDAGRFCAKLSAAWRRTARLPTGVEWEYACRAGGKGAYCFGDDLKQLGEYSWFGGNSAVEKKPQAHPVGQKRPNAWGLFDVHGNVAEWCSDVLESSNGPPVGGPTPPQPEQHILRGGSFRHPPGCCRGDTQCGCGRDPAGSPITGLRVLVEAGPDK